MTNSIHSSTFPFLSLPVDLQKMILKLELQTPTGTSPSMLARVSKAFHTHLKEIQEKWCHLSLNKALSKETVLDTLFTSLKDARNEAEAKIATEKLTQAIQMGFRIHVQEAKQSTFLGRICFEATEVKNNLLYPYFLNLIRVCLQFQADPNANQTNPPLLLFVSRSPKTLEEQSFLKQATSLLLEFGANPDKIFSKSSITRAMGARSLATQYERKELSNLLQAHEERPEVPQAANTSFNQKIYSFMGLLRGEAK